MMRHSFKNATSKTVPELALSQLLAVCSVTTSQQTVEEYKPEVQKSVTEHPAITYMDTASLKHFSMADFVRRSPWMQKSCGGKANEYSCRVNANAKDMYVQRS